MRLFVCGALALLAAGCASITRGHTNLVQINSSPPEAQARTSMGHVCTTPCTLQFNRKDEFSVVFTKPGFHSAQIEVKSQIAGAGVAGFAGNVILGGVPGMVVDAATGATLEHAPNPVTANLVPLKKGEQPRLIKIEPPAPEPIPAAGEGGSS